VLHEFDHDALSVAKLVPLSFSRTRLNFDWGCFLLLNPVSSHSSVVDELNFDCSDFLLSSTGNWPSCYH
jgi:hypothetical protein